MNLREALDKKKEMILSLWIERTLDTYISSGFFKRSKDQFANPVGANIRKGLTRLYELLISGAAVEELTDSLDTVIRIRAVQEFTPAQAVSPVLELKWVVKQVFSSDTKCRDLLAELDPFDCDVDRAALKAFDMYVDCREQLHNARIRELKSGSYILTDSACASAAIRDKLQEIKQIN